MSSVCGLWRWEWSNRRLIVDRTKLNSLQKQINCIFYISWNVLGLFVIVAVVSADNSLLYHSMAASQSSTCSCAVRHLIRSQLSFGIFAFDAEMQSPNWIRWQLGAKVCACAFIHSELFIFQVQDFFVLLFRWRFRLGLGTARVMLISRCIIYIHKIDKIERQTK